ncbi:MAG TPA: T9SS type A sorting domain-containing protein [Mucilaginibacter sp.]|nr:T9SS type A sorting domain-containing protein [Mucilaginibacter sp.]
MKLLKNSPPILWVWYALALISSTAFAQAPNIAYTPSTYAMTQNTAITPMTPANSGGAVGTFGYGTATGITGGSLDHPYGVVTDASGNVYVANLGVDKKDPGSVLKYNVSSHAWSTFATDSVNNPSAIAIDNSGNVYVLNYQRSNNGNGNYDGNAYIAEYNSSGTLLNLPVQGLGPATGIAINNSNGNLDVAEESANGGNAAVVEFTTSGAVNFTLTNTAIPNPVNVATDNSGNIYVLDNTKLDVVKFSSTGSYLSIPVSTGLVNPFGLYIDGSGNIYVSDSGVGGTKSLKVYNSSGTLLTTLSGLTDPEGMTTDSKGNLYVTDYTNNTLTEYQPTGGYFISGKLPPGLSFNYATGVISGTPTTTFASTTYTITAYNASGSSSTTVTISCTANASAPTIVYVPSVQVFTTGTIDTLKATTTNNPNQFSSSPGLPAGFSFTSSGNIMGTTTTVSAATVYTITATNTSTGLSATTTVSLAFVKDNYWTGKQSNVWTDKQNWSAKTVPTSTTYASIGVVNYTGPDPVISATDGNQTVGYLVMGALNSATVTVQSGLSLTVNNILQVNNNATPVFSGAGTYNVISTGIVSVIGTGDLTITSATGTSFVLQSTSAGSASVDAMTSGSINGQVTVQRYLTAQRGYRLLASPVNYSGAADGNGNLAYSLNYVKNSAYVTGTTLAPGGFDVSSTVTTTSENPTLYLYREDVPVSNASFISGNYRGISNITNPPTYSLNNESSTYTIPVSNGFLFFFRGNRASASFDAETKTTYAATTATLSATGYLNQGQIIFRDWYNASSTAPGFSNPSATVEGFNLAANPYACTISLDNFNTTTTTSGIYGSNIAPFFYELNPKTQNYDIYEAGIGYYTNSGSKYIASGQGFFVQATNTGGELIFNETAKTLSSIPTTNLLMTTKGRALAANTAGTPQTLRLQMALDTVNTDDMLIVFDNNAKPGYAFAEDALHKTGSGKVNLSSISNDGQALSINKLPLRDGLVIPLKVGSNAYSTYTLNLAQAQGLPQVYDVWLKDAFTGDSVNMRNTTSYTFSITTDTGSYGAKRFSIAMRQNPALKYKLLNFDAQKSSSQVKVTWTTQNEFDFTSFAVERSNDAGKTFNMIGSVSSDGSGSYSFTDKAPAAGSNLYRLRQQDINGSITYSAPVDVKFATGSTVALNLYPNPAVNTINVSFVPKSQDNTTYNVSITNSAGLVVANARISGTNWQGNINNLLPGTYLVNITNNKDNQLVGQTKFIKM